MTKETNQQPNVDETAIRAQIEAELRAEYEEKAKEQAEVEEKARKELEEKLAKQEKAMEKELAKDEANMKAKLAKEKKVPIHIPDDPLNPDDVVPVGINGVIYAIPRGQEFMVPESIYNVWKNSYEETAKANRRIKVEQNKEIQIL